MLRWRGLGRSILLTGLLLAACGGRTISEATTSSGAQTTSTVEQSPTVTTAPATTTTSATSTTTTTIPVSAESIHELFAAYLDGIVAKDWQSARDLATGPAADYATFVEHLDKISTQPDWQLDSITEPDCCEVVDLADERFATAASIAYTEANGSRLAVENPVATRVNGDLALEYWGEDLSDEGSGPSLAVRLKNLSTTEYDPGFCTSGGHWAYIPGGTDTPEEVSIIVIGSVCDPNNELVGDPSLMTIFTADGAIDIPATTLLWEGGPRAIPAGETRLFLAIYTVPLETAAQELFGGVRFQLPGTERFQFTIEIGSFQLGE